ncbi:MAG: GDP-mannose 4,6-dehydratase [Candidatus Pacebacteria bacterium]|nr:GDP-mannose 4,6-dehydratase [Candidatus Paceibacterota bacterium]MCF7856943.1 GDP-mannose 4,6-dehydratase [Candidatus Paceibacterota bacterium]
MKKKKVFVTGITGQDGSYLTPILLDAGYEVHALVRLRGGDRPVIIDDLAREKKVIFHTGSLTDLSSLSTILEGVRPDEVYNLAAQSHVVSSFKSPVETWDVNYYGLGRLVNEALRVNPDVRIYQASTSEMFGNSPAPQSENTPFDPQSPYAMSKAMAHTDFIMHKRASMGAFAVSGILFNHESPRRGRDFVTRKITFSLAKIAFGLQECLELGNLNAVRDWGHAEDYVRAMFMMLQQDTPEDYVIASGESHSVRDFVEIAAQYFGINIAWEGEGKAEIGRNKMTGKIVVKVNPEFYRPREVNFIQGDATKAHTKLGWKPRYSFSDIVTEMVKSDQELVRREYKL